MSFSIYEFLNDAGAITSFTNLVDFDLFILGLYLVCWPRMNFPLSGSVPGRACAPPGGNSTCKIARASPVQGGYLITNRVHAPAPMKIPINTQKGLCSSEEKAELTLFLRLWQSKKTKNCVENKILRTSNATWSYFLSLGLWGGYLCIDEEKINFSLSSYYQDVLPSSRMPGFLVVDTTCVTYGPYTWRICKC